VALGVATPEDIQRRFGEVAAVFTAEPARRSLPITRGGYAAHSSAMALKQSEEMVITVHDPLVVQLEYAGRALLVKGAARYHVLAMRAVVNASQPRPAALLAIGVIKTMRPGGGAAVLIAGITRSGSAPCAVPCRWHSAERHSD
jgi:hypothetical protein